MISLNKIFTVSTPHTHILWENLQAYNIEGTVQQERNTKTKEHAKLLELCDNKMSFTPIHPNTSPHTIHKICFQEFTSLFPKELVTT